ncbi:hypothetical protein J5839_05085 [Methanosarcinaceae archaeon]|nr:hypothetical protein [Methanosarcinaceae archaeon]
MAENNDNDKGTGRFGKIHYNRTAGMEKQIFDDVMEKVNGQIEKMVKDLQETVETDIRNDLQPETAPYDRLRLIEQRIHEISKTQDGIVREIVDLKSLMEKISKELSRVSSEVAVCQADFKESKVSGQTLNAYAAGRSSSVQTSPDRASSDVPQAASAAGAGKQAEPSADPFSGILSEKSGTPYKSYFEDPQITRYADRPSAGSLDRPSAGSSARPAATSSGNTAPRRPADPAPSAGYISSVAGRSKAEWPSPVITPAGQAPEPKLLFEELPGSKQKAVINEYIPGSSASAVYASGNVMKGSEAADPFDIRNRRSAGPSAASDESVTASQSPLSGSSQSSPSGPSQSSLSGSPQSSLSGSSQSSPSGSPQSSLSGSSQSSPSASSKPAGGPVDPYGVAPTLPKNSSGRGRVSPAKYVYTDDDDGIDYNKDCEYIYAESGPSGRPVKKGNSKGSQPKQEKTIVNDDEGSELIMRSDDCF